MVSGKNRNYNKGARKERKLVNLAKENGFAATRSAGSHGIWDVVIVDHILKRIKLVQCKPNDFSELNTNRLLEKYKYLNGFYKVEFVVE